jgi:two-component system cell cycle sensor histidine kinase/response regulator CckA
LVQALVADNHPVIRQFLSELLTREGYAVLTAEDGLSALDLLAAHRPQVLIVDLIMPNIDGWTLCRMVRSHPVHREAFLIVLSAVAAELPLQAADLEANAYVAKGPLQSMGAQLLEVLRVAREKGFAHRFKETQGLEHIHAREITRELLGQRRHFEIIFSSLDEGIVEITGDGRVVYVNPSAAAMIGLAEEAVLARTLEELLPQEQRKAIRELLHKSPPREQPTAIRIGQREVEIRLYPLGEEKGRAVVLLVDVTERKRFEEQLQRARRLESIGTLAAGVAHDFNNLLTVVQGNADMMLMDFNPTHPHYSRLQEIGRQVQSAKRLTGQLLGYARKGRFEIQTLDLNQMVQVAAEAFGRARKEITITTELDPELRRIEGDAGQLEQLILNLLLNAGDAMPQGGHLTLRTRNATHRDMSSSAYRPRKGRYAMVVVRDTGKGMDEQTLGRVFEPFFTTKEMGRGTGLGLASVYGTVKGHGGYVEVESQPGKGTTFAVFLPVKANGEACASEEATSELQGVILLVDDEEMVRAVARDMLRSLSFEVLTAASGQEAVELFKAERERIRLVILDIVLPGLGGGDIFRQLREIEPELKVLVCSGYSIQGEADALLREGALGFIQKPFSLATLKQEVNRALGGAPSKRRPPKEAARTRPSAKRAAPKSAPSGGASAARTASGEPGREKRSRPPRNKSRREDPPT